MIPNGFVALDENEMSHINGGLSILGGVVILAFVACGITFVVSAGVAAYNTYKDMERKYG